MYVFRVVFFLGASGSRFLGRRVLELRIGGLCFWVWVFGLWLGALGVRSRILCFDHGIRHSAQYFVVCGLCWASDVLCMAVVLRRVDVRFQTRIYNRLEPFWKLDSPSCKPQTGAKATTNKP